MRAAWWLGWALITSGCAHRIECTAHGGSVVRRIETTHFVVSSDLPEPLFKTEVRKLEQLWDAWVVFFGTAPEGTARLQVVLSEPETSSEFMAETNGFVRFTVPARLFSGVTTYSKNGKQLSYSSNAHELVHLVSRFWLPRQPRWIAEGLAKYLGDANFVRDSVIRMGRWEWDGGTVESLETLWAWDEMRETGQRQLELYQSAWAWMHYLSNRDEVRLAKLWKALATMPSARAAFESVIPRDEWPALHQKVQSYLNEGRYRGWETTVTREPQLSTPAVIEPWAVHLLRRDYSEGAALRRAETRKALELIKGEPPPELTLARFEDEYRGPELSQVVDTLPNDARAMRLAASAPDVSPRRRFELLERAMLALPDDVEVLTDFAAAATGRNDPRRLEASGKAATLAPWWPRPRFQHAAALAEQGRCAEADLELEQMLGLAVDDSPVLERQVVKYRAELAKSCEPKP
jgi:tetratricopeptide (TPR) repeat protein